MNTFCYIDDCYIDDSSGETSPSPVVDERFVFKQVVSDGSYLEWSTYTGSVHYALVDENPPVSTDYIYSTAPGQRESFGIGSSYVLSDGSTIEKVIPLAIARKNTSTDILLGVGTGISGTFSIESFQNLPTSYSMMVFSAQALNPFGVDWSEGDINALEFYMMSSGTYT
jgi:hypothetical protein